MADLSSLIRLHKYELDEKRRALAELYGDLALLEKKRLELLLEYEREKQALDLTDGVSFTFGQYTEAVKKKQEDIDDAEDDLIVRIDNTKDELMEIFGELKKYEMTQAERDRLEAEQKRIEEGKIMDEIGLEGFRRKGDG